MAAIQKKGPIKYFLGIHKEVAILIPKKRGVGYLRSPFGGHHTNRQYFDFCDYNIKGKGDSVDIVGYLVVGISFYSLQPEYDQCVKEIMEALCEIFPQADGYEEIHSEFWNYIRGTRKS